MSEYNWHLKKSNKTERRVSLSSDDMDKMLDWHDAFLTFNPPSSPQRKATVDWIKENTNLTPGAFEMWIVLRDLEQIKLWNKYYVQKHQENEHDKAIIAVINQALNPEPPKEPVKK